MKPMSWEAKLHIAMGVGLILIVMAVLIGIAIIVHDAISPTSVTESAKQTDISLTSIVSEDTAFKQKVDELMNISVQKKEEIRYFVPRHVDSLPPDELILFAKKEIEIYRDATSKDYRSKP